MVVSEKEVRPLTESTRLVPRRINFERRLSKVSRWYPVNLRDVPLVDLVFYLVGLVASHVVVSKE